MRHSSRDAALNCLYGAVQAQGQMKSDPIFPEDTRKARMNDEARTSYEKVMGKLMGQQVAKTQTKATKTLAKEMLTKYTQGGTDAEKAKVSVKRAVTNVLTPDAVVPDKIYGKVDQKMDGFVKRNAGKTYEEAKADYQATVGKEFRQSVKRIDDIFTTHKDNAAAINRELGKIGLTKDQVFHTRQWLNWMAEGGPYFGNKPAPGNIIRKGAENVTKSYVAWNPHVTIGHGMSFIPRALAKYTPLQVYKGMVAAHQASGGKLWSEIPALHREGVYGNNFAQNPKSKWTQVLDAPLKASQTVADNVAYHIGKEAGDTALAMRNIALQDKPWNAHFIYQNASGKDSLSMMRFHLNYTRVYAGMYKDLVMGIKNGDAKSASRAATGIALYSTSQALLLGGRAAVPAIVWSALPDDWKEHIQAIPSVAGGIKKVTGIDIGHRAAPLGGFAAGVSYSLLNKEVGKATSSALNLPAHVVTGDVKTAAADVLQIGGAVGTLLYKSPVIAEKALNVIGDYLKEEIPAESLPEELRDAVFGKEEQDEPQQSTAVK